MAGLAFSYVKAREAIMLMFEVHMDYAARPSVLFNIRDRFSDFLKHSAAAGKADYPSNLESLLNQAGVKLVLSDKNDPDGAGFVQCRTAFFVAGARGCVNICFVSWTMSFRGPPL